MKLLSKVSIATLLFASSSVYAMEPAFGWYAGLMLGPSYMPETDFTITPRFIVPPFVSPLLSGRATYSITGNVAAQFGYRCNKFRYEGEVYYTKNNVNKLLLNGFTIRTDPNHYGLKYKANTSILAGLFNAYFELYDEDYSDSRFIPYVGLGLGYANIHNSFTIYRFHFPLNDASSGATNAPIGQAIFGVNYFFSDNASLGTDFRYMTTNTISRFDSRVTLMSWNFLFNYSFDQPLY